MAAFEQVRRCKLRGQFSDPAIHLRHGGGAGLRPGKARGLGEIGLVQQGKDPVPGIISIGNHHNMPVGRGEGLTIGIKLAAIATGANRRIKGQPAQMLAQHETGEGFIHRHFNQLPLASPLPMEQRGDGGISGVEAGNLVRDQRGEKARRGIAIHFRQQAGYARSRLDHIVIGLQIGIGPILPEPDAVHIDNIRTDRADRLVIQPQPFQRLAPDIGHEDIGLSQQLAHNGMVIRLLEIERDGAFAMVEAKERRRHPRSLGTLRGPAQDITAARRFDLDHFCPQVSQNLGAIRTEDHRGQVYHLDALQHGQGRHFIHRFRQAPWRADWCGHAGQRSHGHEPRSRVAALLRQCDW